MAIRCDKCGRDYDVTLFQFGRTVRCECGNTVTLSNVQTQRDIPAPPTRLILVRHGETDWNVESRIQGHEGTRLNARGRQEAKLLAGRLAGEGAANLYSSDLARAMETADEIAAATGLPIEATPELREAFFGEWEGKTYREVAADFPGDFANWVESDFHEAPPGGESAAELRERVIAFLAEVCERHPGQASIIVTHGGPCKYAVAHVLGISPKGVYRYAIDNASISVIEIAAYGWRLVTMNDMCHLKKAEGGRRKAEGVFTTKAPRAQRRPQRRSQSTWLLLSSF